MNKVIVLLLLLGFLTIAVFGFFTMASAMGDGHMGCLAATTQGAPCPVSDPIGSIAFHLDAFKGFSTALVVSMVFVLLAGVMRIAFAVVNGREPQDHSARALFVPSRVVFFGLHSLRETLRRFHFLALLELSPAPV